VEIYALDSGEENKIIPKNFQQKQPVFQKLGKPQSNKHANVLNNYQRKFKLLIDRRKKLLV